MTKVKDLAYDIEQLYIEGYNPKAIAAQLGCPLAVVYDWIESIGCSEPVADTPQDEVYSPYNGA
jgi:hypothetical protein